MSTSDASARRGVIGVGLDVVEIARFRQVLARRPGLLARVFSEQERADMALRVDPVPGLAARFAAKEAAMKALGVGIGAFDFRDVEVARAIDGKPLLVVHGRASSVASGKGVVRLHVSLAHSATTAQAVVLAD